MDLRPFSSNGKAAVFALFVEGLMLVSKGGGVVIR
jgi:hypothetical protein